MPTIDSLLENNEKSSHKHEFYLTLFTKRSKFLVLLFETFIGNDPILLLFIYKIFHHSKSSQRMIRLSIDFWTKNFQINSHSVHLKFSRRMIRLSTKKSPTKMFTRDDLMIDQFFPRVEKIGSSSRSVPSFFFFFLNALN